MPEKIQHYIAKSKTIPLWMSNLQRFVHIGNEVKGCDALFLGQGKDLAVECGNSARNEVRNVVRNADNGVDTIIITPSFAINREVSQKLSKHLPEQLWPLVGIMTLNTLRLLSGKEIERV